MGTGVEKTYLDRQERLLGVAGVLVVEAREKLQVSGGPLPVVKVGWWPNVRSEKCSALRQSQLRTAVEHHLRALRECVYARLDGFERLLVRDNIIFHPTRR